MLEGRDIVATRGVAAAGPAGAARVGAQTLKRGGNAMDAAASIACAMLQPESTGIGGYVLAAVVLEGGIGRVWSLDANALAPAAAHERMFEVRPGHGRRQRHQ